MREFVESLAADVPGGLGPDALGELDPELVERQREALDKRLAEIGREHGTCVGIQLAAVDPDDPEQQTWFLILEDGHRAVVSLCRSSGRISRLDLPGEIPPEGAISVEEVPVRMSDGAILRTFLFRQPDDEEPRPVVLCRNPYLHDHGQFRYARFYKSAARFLELGYTYVVQALRGTHGSGGDFRLLHPCEIDDGYDTVTWVAAQPFCNGRVATFGISYEGFTAVAAGVRHPPGLGVVVAASYPTNLATDYFNSSGVIPLSDLEYLHYMYTGRGVTRTPAFKRRCTELLLEEPDLTRYDQLIFGIDIPEWKALASAYPDPDAPLWSERQITDRLHEIETPGYHFAGLGSDGADPVPDDGDLGDVVRAFQRIDSGPHREKHRLFLGAWGHHGLDTEPTCVARVGQILAHHLGDAPLEWATEPRIQMASCRASRQLTGDRFPLPDVGRQQSLYFLREGDRFQLAPTPGSPEARSSYEMQPTRINTWKDAAQYLQFEMECDEQLRLLGPAEMDLHLEIDVPQVDLMVYIGRASPDRKDRLLQCRPATRVRRQGAVTRVCLEIEPMRAVFEPGETLVVQFSSNVFPHWIRNRHNAADEHYFERFSPARIALLHDAEHPSRITFTIEDPV